MPIASGKIKKAFEPKTRQGQHGQWWLQSFAVTLDSGDEQNFTITKQSLQSHVQEGAQVVMVYTEKTNSRGYTNRYVSEFEGDTPAQSVAQPTPQSQSADSRFDRRPEHPRNEMRMQVTTAFHAASEQVAAMGISDQDVLYATTTTLADRYLDYLRTKLVELTGEYEADKLVNTIKTEDQEESQADKFLAACRDRLGLNQDDVLGRLNVDKFVLEAYSYDQLRQAYGELQGGER